MVDRARIPGDFSDHEPNPELEMSEADKVERVNEFISTLYFELPEFSREKVKGSNLLEIEDLFISKIQPPLTSEDLIAIGPGKVQVLIGPNGAGKSTLFKMLTSGNVPDGINHKSGLKIGYLPQEANFDAVANLTLKDFLETFSGIVAEAQAYDFDYNLVEASESIFFQGTLQTKVGQLSGGEKTKLQMLVLLLKKAELVLLDEPTNHIDMEGQALLTALINKLSQSGDSIMSGTSFIISSHNENFLQKNSKDGALQINVTDTKRQLARQRKYQPEKAKARARYKIPWLMESDFSGEIFKGGNVNLNGKEVYFEGIDSDSKIILAGPNGSGKSAFLEYLVNPQERRLAGGAGAAYLPQEWPKEVSAGSLRDFLNFYGIDEHNFSRNFEESGFKKRRPEITNWQEASFSSFSLGEQKLLWFLATSAGGNPSILILDEPTNHLDQELKKELIRAILDFPGAVLTVTHDEDLINAILDKASTPSAKFWLLEKNSKNVDSWSVVNGINKYFSEIARKAQQTVERLKI